MNRYKVMLPVLVNGEHKQGDEFEYEFTEFEEQANLQSGLLEIVPATYRVITTSRVYDTETGETFTKALTLGQERHLIEGGFIEKVEESKAPEKTKAAKESKEEEGD